MKLLGIELSDAGILVAGGQPARLLEIDQNAFTSPGYAVLNKKQVLIGRAAEGVAHLQPRKILNHFWDQLSTEPIEHPVKQVRNQAEVAFIHLAQIWEQIRAFGDSIVIAVPDHYARTQLGLLLGMAQELGVRVLGYSPMSITSAVNPEPGEFLLYLDIHLHRMELTCMRQAERLYLSDSMTLPGKGLLYWHKEWVEAIASEFVHTTRFDPLHRAETEQELYHRLPKIAAELENSATASIQLKAGQSTYRSAISIEQLLSRNADCINELHRAIVQIRAQQGLAPDAPVTLLVSHRIASLPGVTRNLSDIVNVQVRALPEGAGALGVLALWDGSEPGDKEPTAVFKTSKPWHPAELREPEDAAQDRKKKHPPTHLLYDSLAYPIGAGPLIIECGLNSSHNDIQIHHDPSRATGSHCVVRRRTGQYFIESGEQAHTTVNGQPVSGTAALERGDIIGLGTNADTHFKLIACLQNDET